MCHRVGWAGRRVDQALRVGATGRAAVHVHVRNPGSPNERYALLFRDFMRAHPDASAAWAIFKTELARIADNIRDYVEVKDPATDVVMVVAERWAAETGWTAQLS